MSQRFEGRNLDEVLTAAAAALGVERFRLTHRVVEEKRGFLGGVKRVVIEAEVVDAAGPTASALETVAVTAPAASPAKEPAPAPETGRRQQASGRTGDRSGGRGSGRRDRPGRGESRGGRGGRGGERGPRQREDLRSGDFSHFAEEMPDQEAQSPGAIVVRDWLEEVIDLANLKLTVRTIELDDRINVRLYGRDVRQLLDRNGELLDALQVLATKSLGVRKVEKNIELDCDGFKERREHDIEELAREFAERVRGDGAEQLLPAMSPVERRIVHVTVQDDPDVTSESRGEGFYKRVALKPRPRTLPES